MSHENKIPATILTGFLGSGKTTLLNHIIRNNQNTKFAIIENEFGEISIDKELIVNFEDDIYDLKNGCVCCSLNGEFANTLLQLLESGKEIDHILVETTGIADPNSVAASFYEKIIRDNIHYNGTVCLIDSSNYNDIYEEPVAARQAAFADLILLNKIDKVNENNLSEINRNLSSINKDADIINTTYGKIDNTILKNLRKTKIKIDNYSHLHTNQYNSIALIFDQDFDIELFKYAITFFNAKFGNNLLRIKGLIYSNTNKYLFQSVKDFGELIEQEMEIGEKRQSKIVFIGKKLDKELILKELNSALE